MHDALTDRQEIKDMITDIETYAKEYHKRKLKLLGIADVVGQSEQLRFLIDKFQTPKGNYLIELLMTEKERKDKKP